MINSVTIAGNLTRDIEVRATSSGFIVGSFSVAVNERFKNKETDTWEDRPNYFDVKIFGNRAEKLQQYLTKGTKIAVCGHLRWSQWEKDGQKRSKVEIIADNIEFMSKAEKREEETSAYVEETPGFYDDDIPF